MTSGFDFQRAHEEEFEAEREAEIAKRFKPDVLDLLERIERSTDRASESYADFEELKTAVCNMDQFLRLELPLLIAANAQAKQSKILTYAVVVLLAVIAFK